MLQADVTAAKADHLAELLFSHVPRSVATDRPRTNITTLVQASKAEIAHEVPVEPALVAASLALLDLDPRHTEPSDLEEATRRIDDQMVELQVAIDELQGMLQGLVAKRERFEEDHFDRADRFREELVSHLKDHMLTLQVAEERKQELHKAIEEGETLKHFFTTQKKNGTQMALLRQWKQMEPVRSNLRRRFQVLSGLQGHVLSKTSAAADEVGALERQVQQKDRVVELLAQRLREAGKEVGLTEAEKNLVELAVATGVATGA